MSARPITIAGGGLAGLALGRALARRGVSVELHEAGHYPRHKVCGEFISGLQPSAVNALDLAPVLAPAGQLSSVRWFLRNSPLRTWRMPHPAYGISRYRLDSDLARDFVAAGGRLHQDSRWRFPDSTNARQTHAEGLVQASGRPPAAPPRRRRWLGLKLHILPPFHIEADLEIHLGRGGYVGVSRVEDGRVNVCGLFAQRPEIRATQESLLASYLNAAGLESLRRRMDAAAIDPDSHSAVAALDFDRDPPKVPWIRVGDSRGMIPPYTGHGMAMALESAAIAIDPLLAYARGDMQWTATVNAVAQAHNHRFGRRLRCARGFHRALYQTPFQQAAGWLTRTRMLPLNTLYHLTRC